MAEYIVRAVFFPALILVAYYFRNDDSKIKIFNLAIPVTFSLSLVLHLFFLKLETFTTSEAWAFSLTTFFNINQSSVIFFEMPRIVKIPLLILGFTSIVYNIEMQSNDSIHYNAYIYSIMIVYTLFLAKIQWRFKTLKTQLIEELMLKN